MITQRWLGRPQPGYTTSLITCVVNNYKFRQTLHFEHMSHLLVMGLNELHTDGGTTSLSARSRHLIGSEALQSATEAVLPELCFPYKHSWYSLAIEGTFDLLQRMPASLHCSFCR